MSYKARATRDSNGMRSICEELFYDGLKAASLGEEKKDVWDVDVELEPAILVDLLSLGPYNLLVSRLINTYKYSPDSQVLAGRVSGVTAISIGKKRYRSRGYYVYEK